jgi:hypothetical protein
VSVLAGVLGIVWLAMVVVAVIGLVRGHLDWARLRSRKHAGGLLGASFVVFILIGIVAPDQPVDDAKPVAATSVVTLPRTLSVTPPTTLLSPTSSTVTVPPAITSTTVQQTTVAPETFAPAPPVAPTKTRLPDPRPFVAPAPAPEVAAPTYEAPRASAYYANCTAARAAGAAPMRRGEPGYRLDLDRDHDGIACE